MDASGNEQRHAALFALEKTIPDSYRWARFGAPELRQRVPAPALAAAVAYGWRHDRVCLMGASRGGKTSLAVAMLRRWVSHTKRPAAFVHAYRLGVARILHPAGHGEPELVEFAMRAPLVLIDDLGGERDRALSALPDILVERHAENRPTWVTTGLTREQLVKRYGQGIVARVFERATMIRVGVDARTEAPTKKK
jgi:DNA replication protein DnaC